MTMQRLSRRGFLGAAAAAPLAFSTALRGARDVPVGLELYSVRTELAKDLLGTVAAVGKMGYQIVEFYAPYLDWTPEMARRVRKVPSSAKVRIALARCAARTRALGRLGRGTSL